MGAAMSFIAKYNEFEDGGDFISHPDFEELVSKISIERDALDDATKLKLETILHEIMATIDQQITDLKHSLSEKRTDIDQIEKNSEACLAYLRRAKV